MLREAEAEAHGKGYLLHLFQIKQSHLLLAFQVGFTPIPLATGFKLSPDSQRASPFAELFS